ncbi:MAG: bacteriohemerythrin [Methylococcaceae bacterium]|nr:bacteriohemerythrin [Methylococcaceae bacterium]
MSSIDIFPWNDNFNTGIPLIDEQHKKLANLLNLLASHVAFNSSIPALDVIFDELAEYAVYHFESEEKIWHDYMPEDPFESDHLKFHSSFLSEVLRLKNEENTKPSNQVIEEILAFLTRWLAAHILESDRAMAMVVIAMQSGMSLEMAKEHATEQMRGTTRVLIDIILSIYESLSTNTLHLMREIAEQKRLTLLINDQERHFETLLATAPVGVFESDINGQCIYINARWSEITGLSLEDAIGDGWTHALPPEDKNKVYAEWSASVTENRPFHLEYRFLKPSGEVVWVLGESASFKYQSNDESTYVGTITNITERKLAEENLRKESEKNLAFLRNASDGIHIIDVAGRVIEASDSFCNMLGYSREEIIGMNIAQWDVGFANTKELLTQVRKQFQHTEHSQFETLHRRKNGDIFHAEVSCHRLELDDHQLLFNSSRDISDRKKIEHALQSSAAHLHTMIENEPECIKTVDAQGSLVEMNPAGLAMIEADSLAEVVGLPVKNLVTPEYQSAFTEMHKRVIAGEKIQLEFEIIGLKGGHRWMETHAVPIQENGVTLHLAVTRDITARKIAEESIQSASLYARSLIEASLDPLVTISADGKITDANTATEKMTGVDRAQLIGSNFADYCTEPERAHVVYQQVFAKGSVTDYPLTIHPVSGKTIDVLYNASAYRDNKGNIIGVFAAARDITERKAAENELRIAATAFEAQEGMMVTNANNIILRVNNAFTAITGYTSKEAIGQTPRLLSSGRQDKYFYKDMWSQINQTGRWQGEILNRRKNGDIYPEHLTITAVKDSHGTITNYVGTHTDITESKAASDEIKNLAFYDPLTQLPNRRLLLDRLKQAQAFSARSDQKGALLFLDLDHFKTLNDTRGHDVGDLLLQQVASRLSQCVREGDTVARLGGDEFVVLLENLSEQTLAAAAQTKVIGNKVLASLNMPYQLNENIHYSTSSMGAAIFNAHEQSLDTILKQADIAMYQAKESGRNALQFFDPKMQEAITFRADLECELRKAIVLKQFQLHYQIQVNNENQASGAETLIRWQHPKRGMISPFHFISLAEETGLILTIGQWVLDTACMQLSLWQKNPLMRDLSLSVNVSAKQFLQTDFVETVNATVQRHRINPARLKLELTESMLVNNIETVITRMKVLNATGIRFELDDFGTGYSSLQYLKKLPIDQLKIDQSFVRDLATDSSDKAIVRTIILMAHSLDINVIAEGVETVEQQQFLMAHGCMHFQGYLFSKPIPIDEFEDLLRKNNLN